MDSLADTLTRDQFIEDCEHLFAVFVDLAETIANRQLIPVPPQEFLQKFFGDVDIPPQGFRGVPAQKETVE